MPKIRPQLKLDTMTIMRAKVGQKPEIVKTKSTALTKRNMTKGSSSEVKTASNKNTRPLNSYMAFRSFYSKIFEGIQQKEISGFVTLIWQTDPFKAKWTLLAKAYSIIRDVKGKDATSLEKFLAISAPYIGIVPSAAYFTTLGWEVVVKEEGGAVVRRNPDVKLASCNQATNYSVDDIIDNCYRHGFVSGERSDIALSNVEPAMTMATMNQSAGHLVLPMRMAKNDNHGNRVDMGASKHRRTTNTADEAPKIDTSLTEEFPGSSNSHDGTTFFAEDPGFDSFASLRTDVDKLMAPFESAMDAKAPTTSVTSNVFDYGLQNTTEVFTVTPGYTGAQDPDWDLLFAPGIYIPIFDPFAIPENEPINISADVGPDADMTIEEFIEYYNPKDAA